MFMNKTKTIYNVQKMARSAREEMRKKAFDLWKTGTTPYKIAQTLKVHERTVGRWIARFMKVGRKAISEHRRGPEPALNRKLDANGLRKLDGIIRDKTPDQLKFPFALWSSRAVKEAVKHKFGVEISRRTARRYMRRLGYTYQCPERRAREQDAEAVRKWKEQTYPQIRAEASRRGAKVMWGDESAILASQVKARGYSPRGTSPVLKAPANRGVRCNFISAVGNKGELYFEFFRGPMNADLFKDFIKRLVRELGTTVFLIVDNLKVHHATCLQRWLEKVRKRVRLFYLPSYSPEMNPDEYVNRDTKAHVAEMAIPNDVKGMEREVGGHLSERKANPEAVRKLLRKKEVAYVLDEC